MGKYEELKERLRRWQKEQHKQHEEFSCLHGDYERQHMELHRQQHELERLYREHLRQNRTSGNEDLHKQQAELQRQQRELRRRFNDLRSSRIELHRMQRHIRLSPPIILVLNVLIWYLVYRYTGFRVIGVFLAIAFTVRGVFEYFFLRRLERRIFTPIKRLKVGLGEIAKGNYDVKLESDGYNEISMLIDSFNEMAQKLHETEKIKLEYEENRRTLIANISHDLKTPITSIQGYIETITEENAIPPESINKYLKIIYNNTAYMNKLIDDLFLFSKLDMQKLDFHFEAVSVRPFINDLMEEFKLEYEENNIEFNYYDSMDEDCIINIDRKRLHQVFRNIIGNAVKYGPEQNLCIGTKLYRSENSIYIDIKDNGPGISEDKLPHIFERFYRIDTERTKDLMSTGLGLAISKELVEAHGGKISVTSVLNEGTCFTVMLPIIHKI